MSSNVESFLEKPERRPIIAFGLVTITFTVWSIFWSAVLFDYPWQALIEQTEQALIEAAERRGSVQTVFVYLIGVVLAFCLLNLLRGVKVRTFMAYQGVAAVCSLLLAGGVVLSLLPQPASRAVKALRAACKLNV